MNWSMRIRQFHRWMAIAFTLGFIINVVALAQAQGEPDVRVYFLVLIPLFLLFPTGLYMFALPYVARLRSGRRNAAEANTMV